MEAELTFNACLMCKFRTAEQLIPQLCVSCYAKWISRLVCALWSMCQIVSVVRRAASLASHQDDVSQCRKVPIAIATYAGPKIISGRTKSMGAVFDSFG
ncbi:MAG: hypothetical protein RLY14_1036 [Planctomycetota bacterium]|jgi:hypothetical protein